MCGWVVWEGVCVGGWSGDTLCLSKAAHELFTLSLVMRLACYLLLPSLSYCNIMLI